MSLNILYEDRQIIVLNKAAGKAVIPGRGLAPEETLVRQVEKYLGAKAYVVHRLDKDSSGLILFAKDAATHRSLNLQFERRQVRKTYLALVQGKVNNEGSIRKAIREFGSGRMGIDRRGKTALTLYRVRERFKNCTLLEVTTETGRRHQIRVHLYSIGHPVIGDPLYGKDRPVGGASRLMLHAYRITFLHPSGQMLTFQAEPGKDWGKIIDLTRRASP